MAADDDVAQAQVHVRKATAASDLGNHMEAAKEYEAAYVKTSNPSLLASVGQAWQLAGDRQKAMTAFRAYVRVAPNGDQRFLCEAKIREIEEQRLVQPAPLPYPSPMAPPAMAVVPPLQPAPYAAYPPPATSFATNPVGPTVVVDASPFYAHWPFWAVLGAAVAGGVVAGVLYARQDAELAMPTTTFGTKQY
jgi:tetratricopeptide (TPR) repeat protein